MNQSRVQSPVLSRIANLSNHDKNKAQSEAKFDQIVAETNLPLIDLCHTFESDFLAKAHTNKHRVSTANGDSPHPISFPLIDCPHRSEPRPTQSDFFWKRSRKRSSAQPVQAQDQMDHRRQIYANSNQITNVPWFRRKGPDWTEYLNLVRRVTTHKVF